MKTASNRGTVLVADDEEIIRNGLAELLTRDGFTCVAVSSGREALEHLRDQSVDALVSDIHMEGNSRLEMIGEARVLRPALPVVLLTGKPTVETAARSVRIPVTAYLTKPLNFEELVAILDAAIGDYRSWRALQTGRTRLREWEKEIARIEADLRAERSGAATGSMGSYLRLTLHQVILMLSDLEGAVTTMERTGTDEGRGAYEAELRHTVDVLERTRRNFKSKELAELRKRIEALLDQGGPSD
jgi:DNA-binding response OmpR family regulator